MGLRAGALRRDRLLRRGRARDAVGAPARRDVPRELEGAVSARRRRAGEAGFTLLEVVIAGGLATLVVLGLSAVTLPLVRAQVVSARGAAAQMGAAAALSLVDREIRQATWI